MNWGSWGSQYTSEQMSNLMGQAYELGITTFDHADIYGGYTTERDFGNAFIKSTLKREQIQFITKCGIQMPCEARPLPVKHYDYSKKHLRMSVENSLRNLHTDYIDLLLLHRPSPLMEAEPIAEEFQKLKEEGKVIQLGVSNFTTSQMEMFKGVEPIAWNQVECSLTHEQPLFDGTLDYMKVQGIGAMAWSPLGVFFKKNSDQQNRIKKVLIPLCEKYSCAEDQLLLAWLMYHPSNIYPVVGTTSASRLKKAVESMKITLEITDWFLLLEASMGKPLP